jgi:protocatechuate 4,5-dioxygenase alpha chain
MQKLDAVAKLMQSVKRKESCLMSKDKEYSDIPGTIVFDSDQASKGYHLNQFCISLRVQKNRDAFKADPEGYIDTFPMTAAQRNAALNQEWNTLLELGGNIYYTSKLAAFHGINFQELAGLMTGMGSTDYRAMMLAGGRSVEGNRFKKEWDENDG